MKRSEKLAVYGLGTWFGCGFVPLAPGTAGTLGALPLYLVVRSGGPIVVLGVAVVVSALGVFVASKIVRDRRDPDPQIVVIDEVAGVLITLAASPPSFSWKALAAGFILFRLLDEVKPWPARAAERLSGGWGVMMDDIVAGAEGAVLMIMLRTTGML